MRTIGRSVLILLIIGLTTQAVSQNAGQVEVSESPDLKNWPVLKHYDRNHLAKIALPLGGIGTGTVSLGGRGDLRDWEIMNRPAKGFNGAPGGNRVPFFAIYVKPDSKSPVIRALMGPVEYFDYESKEGRKANNHGLPRFRECSFDAAYPFGQVNLSDPDMPVNVRLKAFNPLIPGDADKSGIPVAILRYVVTNKTSEKVTVSVCGSMENFIGSDGSQWRQDWKGDFIPTGAKENRNEFRKSGGIRGIYMYSDGVSPEAEQWGTIALSTLTKGNVSYRTSVAQGGWGNDILDFWDDFSGDGILTEKEFTGGDTPRASLAVLLEIPAHGYKEITFLLTWYFPNRFGWSKTRVGNYYTTQYKDAWDVVEKTAPEINNLEKKTIEFVQAFCKSDLPEVVKEAALFNISTLRTQTCFRTEDGKFYGWEGTMDKTGSCHGSCTHVWNYEQATAFLFGGLSKSMREIEFGHATNDFGLMSFRVGLPLENARASQRAAADGQMGTIMKMYRDWQLSADNKLLEKLWPRVKPALSFCWIEGGWDADKDGVMEGCQHNTMDVEYYGPNPQMQLWYLGALKAAEKMARFMNDGEFASTCGTLFQRGRVWTDEHLFNGEYYIQDILPPMKESNVSPYLKAGMGSVNLTEPDYQLASGCLVDQLVGQYMAHICDLGYLVKPENVRTTLKSIMKYNYKESMHDHFNNMRSYALGDESALLMASYPKDRPKNPFPYFSEVMTGFEYTAAAGMLYEGQTENGLRCIRNIRSRYDGRKRSPFDEAECGHHYARAMASWAAVLALTGFNYSAVQESMTFAAKEGKFFWSNGYAYGTIDQKRAGDKNRVKLTVLKGPLKLREFTLRGFGRITFEGSKTLKDGETFTFELDRNDVSAGIPIY